jgi:AcrR family transcriptional regulator
MSETLSPFPSFTDQSPTRRLLTKRRTEHRLLEAARPLFAERGYDGVTVRDIAAAADVSTGAIFAHFNSKADVFNRIVESCYDELYRFMSTLNYDGLSLRDKLVALLGITYEYQSQKLGRIQATNGYGSRSCDASEIKARLSIKRILSLFRDTLEEGVEAGELSKQLNIDLAVEMLWDCCICQFGRGIVGELEAYMSHDRLADRIDVLLKGYWLGAP